MVEVFLVNWICIFMHFITIMTKKIEKESWQPYYRKKDLQLLEQQQGNTMSAKNYLQNGKKFSWLGHILYFFLTKMIIFFFSTTVVNHPSYIVRGPSQQVKPVVKPPKPPPKIQQLHYCDVCKISCAGRSNFPLEICI